MSHADFAPFHQEAMREGQETLAARYRAGQAALGGGCPLDLLSEGGFCEPIPPATNLSAFLADNELPCGCLPGQPHGAKCSAAQPDLLAA